MPGFISDSILARELTGLTHGASSFRNRWAGGRTVPVSSPSRTRTITTKRSTSLN